MILTCPACGTRYTVDSATVGAEGRKVRCTQCGHSWHQRPDPALNSRAEPDPAPLPLPVEPGPAEPLERPAFLMPAPAAPEPMPAAPPSAPPAPPAEPAPAAANPPPPLSLPDDMIAPRVKSRGRAGFGWFVLVLFLVVLGGTLYNMREDIVRLWPPAARLYEVLRISLDLPGSGLRIESVRPSRIGGKVVVEGIVINISTQPREIPPLRMEIYRDPKTVLMQTRFRLDVPRLAPGQGASFRHELDGIPPTEINVRLVFEGPAS